MQNLLNREYTAGVRIGETPKLIVWSPVSHQWRIQTFSGGGGSHPDPEIRGVSSLNNCFSALRASVWSKNKGGPGPPGPLPGSATGHLPCFPAFPYLPILVLFLVFHVFIFCSVARICGVALSSLALSIKDILEACRRKSYLHQLTPGPVSP